MLIAYWIVAGLAAAGFLLTGLFKLVTPAAALPEKGMAWAVDFRPIQIRLIAAAEVVGAVGLVLPMLTGIAPVLSPIAAVALGIIMVGAVTVHARRKENPAPSVVLLVLALATAVLGFLVLAP